MIKLCRIALYRGVNDLSWLKDTLSEFECSMGGDGNGYFNQGADRLLKGLGVSTDTIAKLSTDEEGIQVFHTRFATVGGSSNTLTHPFDCGEYVLVHNGGWYDYDLYDESDEEVSDTATAAALVRKHGPGVLASDALKSSGVWVLVPRDIDAMPLIFHRGQHKIFAFDLGAKATGKGGEGWMIASQIPLKGSKKAIEMKSGNMFAVDPVTGEVKEAIIEPIEPVASYTRITKPYSKTYSGYTSQYGWDDDDYYAPDTVKTSYATDNFIPCSECGGIDYAPAGVSQRFFICASCVEWYETFKERHPDLAEGFAQEDREMEQERLAYGGTIDNGGSYLGDGAYDGDDVNLPALYDKGVDLTVSELFDA